MIKTTFDWEESLRLSNNKEDLAKELLNMFKNELPKYQNELRKALRSNDTKQLQQQSHKLHGACCYIGVPKLRELTKQLESYAQSYAEKQISVLVNQINLEITEVLKAIKQL